MTENTTNITDTELLQKLKESYIDAEQKKELETLIPKMNGEERNALITIINEAKTEKDRVEPIYQEELGKLNEKYTNKLNHLVKEETKNAFKEAEETEEKEESEEMKNFETEIDAVESTPTDKPAEAKGQEQAGKKKHGLRNLILILLLLALIAGSALLALSYL